MSQIIVLAAGNVGRYVAYQLKLAGHSVTIADISEERLANCSMLGLDTMCIDISDPDTAIYPISAMYDAVVNTVPGNMARAVQRRLLTAGCPLLVDTTFGEGNPFDFEDLIRMNPAVRGTLFVPDMGIAPGLSNVLVAHARAALGVPLDSAEVYVGGLPTERYPPWEYQTSFNLPDLMSEYERWAQVIRDRQLTKVPAMSEIKDLFSPEIGHLEGFISDGLRTLAGTQQGQVNSLSEYTLRYPGHCKRVWTAMKEGTWNEEYLSDAWTPRSKETFTFLEVRARGVDGRSIRLNTLVHDDEVGDSMAVSTGACAAAATIVLLEDEARQNGALRGVCPPEHFTPDQREKLLSVLFEMGVGVRWVEPSGL